VNPRTSGRGRLRETLLVIAFFALLTTVVFVSVAGWKYFRGQFVPVSREVLWMSPLSHLLWFAALMLPVIVATPLVAQRRARALAIGVAVWLSLFSILLPLTAVARIAAAILAAGVATVAARRLAHRDAWFSRLGQLSALMLVALGAGAGVVEITRGLSTRRAYAQLDGTPVPDAPNVLLLILDTVRAASMSVYGFDRETTPYLSELATHGTVFDRAVAPAPWTLPSHASIFTGAYPGRLPLGFLQPYRGSERTIAEALGDAGYETVGFVGNHFYTGWDSGLGRGFHRFVDYRTSGIQVLKSSWIGSMAMVAGIIRARNAREVRAALKAAKIWVVPKPASDPRDAVALNDALLDWYDTKRPRPWFAFINYFDAHGPYLPRMELTRRFRSAKPKLTGYHAEIYMIDAEIRRLMTELEQRGGLRNTIVIVTSDHGEHFGEHGFNGHGNTLYNELLHVPLIVRFDGTVPAGRRVAAPVTLRDLAATIEDLTRLPRSGGRGFPGRSLAWAWSSAADSASGSAAVAELYHGPGATPQNPERRSIQVSLVDGEWHYIWNQRRKTEELYAYRADTAEARNEVGNADGRQTADRIRERIRQAFRQDLQEAGRPDEP
jgi:arylsulfatase A-like enzyme